jgi:hypothetical protein
MPDPIDELENFSIPGPPMNPLPAAEVRRRGNRIRRRNNALATVGGLAVVAIIATPFALAAGGGTQSEQPVGPLTQPPNGWMQTIPAEFDLTAGYPDDTEQTDAFTFDVDGICGSPGWAFDAPTPGVDGLGADASDPNTDGGASRALVLYEDGQTAERSLVALQEAVEACPTDPNGRGLPLDNEVVSSSSDSFVFTNQARDGELLSDLTVYQAVRSGNALYLATAHTSAGGSQAMGVVDNLLTSSAPVVDQLCTFSVEGCSPDEEPSEAVEEPTGLTGEIPDDFPLEKGLPTSQENGEVGLEGPSHDLDLAVYNVENSVRACGAAPTGLPEPVDTLYAGYRGLSEGILRQLMTFASVEDAQAYVDGVIAPFAACPEDTDGRGVSKVYEVTQPDLGDATSVSTMRVEVDGEPGIGYQVVALTRVGQAVVFTLVNNDGEPFDADLAATYVENTQTVVDEMG